MLKVYEYLNAIQYVLTSVRIDYDICTDGDYPVGAVLELDRGVNSQFHLGVHPGVGSPSTSLALENYKSYIGFSIRVTLPASDGRMKYYIYGRLNRQMEMSSIEVATYLHCGILYTVYSSPQYLQRLGVPPSGVVFCSLAKEHVDPSWDTAILSADVIKIAKALDIIFVPDYVKKFLLPHGVVHE